MTESRNGPPTLPPLTHPFGIDANRAYKCEKVHLHQVIEIPGQDLLDQVSDVNKEIRVLDVPPPLVPLINVFEADRHRDRPPEIEWASINEIHTLTRQGERILLNANGDIMTVGRHHMNRAGWEAWLRLHQSRLAEAQEAAAKDSPVPEAESAETVRAEPPKPRPWRTKEAKTNG